MAVDRARFCSECEYIEYTFSPHTDYDYEADPAYIVDADSAAGAYIDAISHNGEIVYMVGECVELWGIGNGTAYIYNRSEDVHAVIPVEQFRRDYCMPRSH